jgi:hypothetical protein
VSNQYELEKLIDMQEQTNILLEDIIRLLASIVEVLERMQGEIQPEEEAQNQP